MAARITSERTTRTGLPILAVRASILARTSFSIRIVVCDEPDSEMLRGDMGHAYPNRSRFVNRYRNSR